MKRKMSGFGLSRILVYDPYWDSSEIRKEGAEPVDFETLLSDSDYISVHAPLNEETKGMIGRREISQMKNHVILINTARGSILDEEAVIEALSSHRIGYAGLDVFTEEPLSDTSPLRRLDNVILSDHAGWYSEESMKELKTKAAINVVDVLSGNKPTYPMNEL